MKYLEYHETIKACFWKFLKSSWLGPSMVLQYSTFLSIMKHFIIRLLDRKGGPAKASILKQEKKKTKKTKTGKADNWGEILVIWHTNYSTLIQVVLSPDHSFIQVFTEWLLWENWEAKMKRWEEWLVTLFFSTKKMIIKKPWRFSLRKPIWTQVSLKKHPLIISHNVSNKYKCTSILGGSWTVRTSYFDVDFSFFFLLFLEASFCSRSLPCDALD